jgi:aminomethyltransferase
MPVQYTSITEEHHAVRKSVGVFDISHMGQFFATGPGACQWLNRLLASNVGALAVGQGQYSFLLNEKGGVIDDLIVYRLAEEEFFLVVNAAKIGEDWNWMHERLADGVQLRNDSDAFAGLAVQGPGAAALYESLAASRAPLPVRNGIASFADAPGRAIVCRTGYTGEDGFEFFCPSANAAAWFRRIIGLGAIPCGLGCRDTLRLEMCYPLNGSDLSPDKTPLEAGLGFFVDLTKSEFIGRDALLAQKAQGLAVKLAPLRMTGKSPPPRSHYPVLSQGNRVGEVCSGGVSPSLGAGIAMAYLPVALTSPGTPLEVEIRGQRHPAEVVKKPFYRKA